MQSSSSRPQSSSRSQDGLVLLVSANVDAAHHGPTEVEGSGWRENVWVQDKEGRRECGTKPCKYTVPVSSPSPCPTSPGLRRPHLSPQDSSPSTSGPPVCRTHPEHMRHKDNSWRTRKTSAHIIRTPSPRQTCPVMTNDRRWTKKHSRK